MNINRSFLEKCNFFNGLEILELTPEWVQSFTDSEGNFNYYYRESKSSAISFSISQNLHDYHLMLSLKKGTGKIYPLSLNGSFNSAEEYLNDRTSLGLNSVIRYEINSKVSHKKIVIPFFNKYPLYTIKSLDFEDWKTLISMSDTKEYKTVVGKEKTIAISKGMNRGRNSSNIS